MKDKLKDFKLPIVKDFNEVMGGDSPGDKVLLCQGHVENAELIMPHLVDEMQKFDAEKLVISVAGGSGVGKSGVAALIAHYLNVNGVKSYLISGDNYPKRRPFLNDEERTNIFRRNGLKGLVESGQYTTTNFEILTTLQKSNQDAGHEHIAHYPWLAAYIEAGTKALGAYLGSTQEQDFAELESILKAFKAKESSILLKRMGREEFEVHYDAVDFSKTKVVIVEWTHALSDELTQIDIPVLLCSTPEETLERRKLRNRGNEQIDTPFISMVLRIEQNLINEKAAKAKVFLTQEPKIITLSQFQEQLSEGE